MDKKSKISNIIAFVIALIIILGELFLTFVPVSDTNVRLRADSNQTHESFSQTDGGVPAVSKGESNGMTLSVRAVPRSEYAESELATLSTTTYSYYNLTVTYTPANTTYKDTTFQAAWKNPNSTWAKGKSVSSYLRLLAGSTALEKKISCRSFSEPVVITAYNTRHPEIKATATVDYVCETLSLSLDETTCDAQMEPCIASYKWSDGTVAPESVDTITLVVDLGTGFVNHMKSYGYTVNRFLTWLLDDDYINWGGSLPSFQSMVKYVTCPAYNKSFTATQRQHYNDALNVYYVINEGADDSSDVHAFNYGVTYKRIYNGVDYGAFSPSDLSQAHWVGYVYCTGLVSAFGT